MTAQFARAPHRGRTAGGAVIHEPHAALLIDFDNVTMGIRSDLTKELKNLLNSDIIKGKVAVQRAYADWRRYPQYIVPLAESSVDLIFAPAYGSAKKNATDIRLAIDAVELVFTRPEIGTIILLSGDSDFSSLVLKLKEYGKYVIGVGIRESASDLLVQNCDEYYSYSALTGLTRAGDETAVVSEDPWELVEMAYRQMVENSDVMRSDRLKQVLLELDPAFDEKALGFQKFNKFLQEAATRGLLSLRKQENGQFEVGPPSDEPVDVTAEEEQRRESRSRRGRRGRGRREERRDDGARDVASEQPAAEDAVQEEAVTLRAETAAAGAKMSPAAAEAPATGQPQLVAVDGAAVETPPAAPSPAASPAASPAPAPSSAPATAPTAAKPARGRGATESGAAAAEPADERPAARRGTPAGGNGAQQIEPGELAAAYRLLRQATTDLVKKSGQSARDSDVKRRMLELQTGWDESSLGFSKFSRFLRQAHDAEVVTLSRDDGGNYDVVPGNAEIGPGEDERGGRRDRGRDRGRSSREDRGPREARAPRADTVAPAAVASSSGDPAAPAAAAASALATKSAASAPAPAAAIGFRRGSRGRAMPAGPPPLLEGQTAAVAKPAAAASAAPSAAQATEPAATETQPTQAASSSGEKAARRTRARKAPAAEAKAGRAVAKTPAKAAAKAPSRPAAGPGRTAARPATKSATPATFDPAALGLPMDAGDIASYMTSYKGVGPRSVQTLIETFGAGGVYDALQNQPDRVREVIGGARGERLIEAWTDDVSERRVQRGHAPGSRTEQGSKAATSAGRARRGGRRGGRRGPPSGK